MNDVNHKTTVGERVRKDEPQAPKRKEKGLNQKVDEATKDCELTNTMLKHNWKTKKIHFLTTAPKLLQLCPQLSSKCAPNLEPHPSIPPLSLY